MYILGICCYGQHDSGLCLLKEGKVVFAAEEERYTRIKHDNRFPSNALEDCLNREGIRINDVDHIGYYCDMSGTHYRAAVHMLRFFPQSLAFLRYAKDYRSHTSIEKFLSSRYGFKNRVHLINHHLAHAASTFLLSPFEEAAIITLDGTGEWTSTAFGLGKGHHVEIFHRIHFPDSLGKFYEAVTQYLGFRPAGGEGKVMGLASYGTPRFYPQFERILRLNNEKKFHVDMDYFHYHLGRQKRFSEKFVREFGPPRKPETEIDDVHKDIAATLQKRVEDTVLHLLEHLKRRTGMTRLCLAGGVALNCQMNGRILAESPFEQLYITPAAGDPGTALGAAKVIHHVLLGRDRREELTHAYWGPSFVEEDCLAAIQRAPVRFEPCDDPARSAAERLAEGKIVGWFQGRMEFGPRALGNRSILADPRKPEMKEILNAKVKRRESFRPFAPSILEERRAEYFDIGQASPFMLLVSRVKESVRDRIPATVHVDGTARVHTVRKDTNPLFYRLIQEFEKITSVPVVLNTSFNVRGEPIVCTPEDAIGCFLNTEMDCLFVDRYLIEKG